MTASGPPEESADDRGGIVRRTVQGGGWKPAARGIVVAAALTALAGAVRGQNAERPPVELRVCVFDNPPIVMTGPGHPRGLAVDILDDVAAREGWSLDYYPSAWPGCLADLEAGRLDLLVGIAYSEERALRYELSRETLVSNYGMVWASADSGISSLLDLEGRGVAVVERNIHTTVFGELMQGFGLGWRKVPRRDFSEVLRAVDDGEADAGVVNRLSSMAGTLGERVRPTGIVFNPIEIRYAAPRGRSLERLRRIDERLATLKRLPGSHYYRALERWLPGGEPRLPVWWVWAFAGAACVLASAVAATLWMRSQVRRQTRQLRAQAVELSSEVRLRRRAQEDLARAAFRDPLTGLPTRLVLRDRLEQALQEATFHGGRVGLLLLDFDRFQSVNELVGQTAGDELLVRLSGRLRGCLPVTATVGRLLGDQFLVLLPHVEDAAQLREVADRLLEACRRPLVSPDTSLVVTCSVGGALFPEDAHEAEELLAGCEAALQDAKQHGRDSFSRYGSEMSSSGLARRRLELSLRNAIAERRLHVDFQPIVRLGSGRVVAAEALVRLRGPEGELVLPEQFVPLAEDRGLVSALGRVMLQGAAAEAAHWTRRGSSQLRLAINVSPYQLEAHDFLDQLDEAIRPTGFPFSRVELELTEGVYLDSLRSRESLLAGLADRGIGLSIDDFGSGYSSLSYLSRLPITTVKIDRSFVQDAPRSRAAAEVVKAVIQLARGLEIHCVAEGIETGAQLAFLRANGCPLGQGFLVARPMSAVALRDWLDRSLDGPALPAVEAP